VSLAAAARPRRPVLAGDFLVMLRTAPTGRARPC
jgi:hypothetical protein